MNKHRSLCYVMHLRDHVNSTIVLAFTCWICICSDFYTVIYLFLIIIIIIYFTERFVSVTVQVL